MVPDWFEALSTVSLGLGLASFVVMVAVVIRHPPAMTVMGFVWPLCALFAGPLAIWFHHRYGGHAMNHEGQGASQEESAASPSLISAAKGTLHCGAGCTLADIIAETLCLLWPAVLPVFGLGWLFAEPIFASWMFDYILALAIGISFQFFAITPMRGLGLKDGLIEAAKVDVLSLTSWQVGMYGLMAVAHFWLFKNVFSADVEANDPAFWFAMQLAMMAGFCTAFPVNRWLIASGIKEAM